MSFCFFSSRRRHTRCSRDWSSDVCSSDLAHAEDSRNFEPSNQSDTDASVGVKVGAGVAWQFTKNIAMFGEYRFTHFSPEFTFRDDVLGNATLSTDVNTHYLLVGVSFRF